MSQPLKHESLAPESSSIDLILLALRHLQKNVIKGEDLSELQADFGVDCIDPATIDVLCEHINCSEKWVPA